MIKIGIKEFPRAYQMAAAICEAQNPYFPLNVSVLLDGIETYRIYDVSSKTYNAAFAAKESQRVFPQKAWTIYNELLDTYLIIWNAARSSPSIRYSVAHEIGHILLDHQRTWPTDIALKKRRKEAEANVFANCLLAPFDAIQALHGPIPYSARLVAQYFEIPASAAAKIKYDYEYWLLMRR